MKEPNTGLGTTWGFTFVRYMAVVIMSVVADRMMVEAHTENAIRLQFKYEELQIEQARKALDRYEIKTDRIESRIDELLRLLRVTEENKLNKK